MFKLIRRLLCVSVLLIIVFLSLSLWSGGEKFRWFGKKIMEKSEEIANKSDKIKNTADRVREGTEKAADTIDKTKKAFKNITGK